MAALAVQTVDTNGVTPTANVAAAGGDTVPYGSIVRFTNGDATDTVVTMVTPLVEDTDLAVADRDITVAAGASMYVRAKGKAYLSTDQDGVSTVSFTYDKVTALTIEVIV